MLDLTDIFGKLAPLLAILGAPLLLWPSIILVIALVKQAKTGTTLKPKHIAIFIGIQVIWLLLILGLSSALILKPLNLRF